VEHTPFTDPPASRIYPYLVTGGYPDCLSTATQQQRRLGHDLSIALVVPQRVGASDSDVVASVGATQQAAESIDLDAAYAYADANLSAALSSGQITVQRFDHGPAGVPTVVFSGSWLAATTLVASGLHEKMTRLLGGDVVAAVPHRELLLVFPAAGSAGMAAVIDAEYRHAPHPLTTALFTLTAHGAVPLP
jgi:hypothetical protein